MLEIESLKYLFTGSFFGLVAGISPGPLLALVISETIRHDRTAGMKIAVSPIITDLPVILLTLFVFSRFSQPDQVLNYISVAGGIYLLYLAYKTLAVKDFRTDGVERTDKSLVKGVIVNLLSPHPYLFWITVGSPYVIKASDVNIYAVIFFILGFYLFLIGSKMIVALLAAHSKAFLNQKVMVWVLRILGGALFVFALILLNEGLNFI
jgi:threonine/homoserine/homoserine lactone efflux protein